MDISEFLKELDLSIFLDIPTACSIRNKPSVKINGDGRIFLYGSLRKLAQEDQRDYRITISSDGCYIALYPELAPNAHFHKDGTSGRSAELASLLRDQKHQLPAVYEIVWMEENKAWVGRIQELPEPDLAAIKKSVKGASGRKTR